jgi:hypothetical protein
MASRANPCGDAITRAATSAEPSGQVDLDHVLANSFRDFHVKGFDYLCLKRSPAETVKVYFFDGDVAQMPEAVVPHDHRYPFWTDCLSGEVVNHQFVELFGKRYRDEGILHERFEYRTPLNGGDGFTWQREAWLFRTAGRVYARGGGYGMRHDELHTITVRPDTVIRLVQFADALPLDVPTAAFRPAGQRDPISLDGLYRPMDADHALMRLAQYKALLNAPGNMRSGVHVEVPGTNQNSEAA